MLRLGPEGRELPLEHWDGDSFVLRPVTENQPGGSVSRVDFALGTGRATMRIEHLDGEGLGLFTRSE